MNFTYTAKASTKLTGTYTVQKRFHGLSLNNQTDNWLGPEVDEGKFNCSKIFQNSIMLIVANNTAKNKSY